MYQVRHFRYFHKPPRIWVVYIGGCIESTPAVWGENYRWVKRWPSPYGGGLTTVLPTKGKSERTSPQ